MPTDDALTAWLSLRGRIAEAGEDLTPVVGVRDGFLHFIETRKETDRVERMRRAVERVRADAAAGFDLSFARLAEWQALVMGMPCGFRRGDAFAKGERYRFYDGIERDFCRCLDEANHPGTPLSARIARAYLDVLFFHPFDDGNGRAASLVAESLLASSGIRLAEMRPLFCVRRYADDERGPRALMRLVSVLHSAAVARAATS